MAPAFRLVWGVWVGLGGGLVAGGWLLADAVGTLGIGVAATGIAVALLRCGVVRLPFHLHLHPLRLVSPPQQSPLCYSELPAYSVLNLPVHFALNRYVYRAAQTASDASDLLVLLTAHPQQPTVQLLHQSGSSLVVSGQQKARYRPRLLRPRPQPSQQGSQSVLRWNFSKLPPPQATNTAISKSKLSSLCFLLIKKRSGLMESSASQHNPARQIKHQSVRLSKWCLCHCRARGR